MSRPDEAASALLGEEVIRPKFYAYLDFVNDPIRINTSGADVSFENTGFPELDGETFIGISGDFIDISPVSIRDGGSERITATLSALIDLDNEMLNEIGDRTNWQGRSVQLWRSVHDATGAQGGAIQHYYTGYMMNLVINPEPQNQIIELTIESYLAAYSEPSNRDYDQSRYDPDDESYAASIAIANGTTSNPITNTTPVGGSISGGGRGAIIGRQISER